ncbi:actin-like protein [Nannochloropsis oceanica]
MMEGKQTEAPACNPIEILDLIFYICQDPHKASSPDVRRRMEGLTRERGGGRASSVGVVSEMEALQQAMERLREKMRRGRLELAEAKRVNLALEETNRARAVGALEQAEEAASMAQKLQAAYQMHEDLKEEVLAGYNKMKQDEEAKRNALNCELLAVEDKCKMLREESNQSKEREEAMRIGMVAVQEELARFKSVQQQCSRLPEEVGGSDTTLQNMKANEEALRSEVAMAQAEIMRMKAEQKTMLHASHHRDVSLVTEIQAREAALKEALARAIEGMADRQAETEGLRSELLSLKEEQAESMSELEKARAETQVLQIEVSKAKEESSRWREEAEAALGTSSSRAALSSAQQDSLKAELLSMQRELARMKEAGEIAQRKAITKLSTVELAFATAQEELERLSEAAEAAQKESKERLTTMMGLEKRENALAVDLEVAQEEIVRWKDAAAAARAEAAEALSREKGTLAAQLQAAQDELSRWKEATGAAQKAASESSASLEEVQFRELSLIAEVEAAQGELTRWKEEAKAAQNEAAGMSMTLADLDAEMNNAKSELARSRAAAESDLEESSSKLSSLEASLGEMRSRQAAVVEEGVAMKAALAKSQAKEKSAREKIAAVREQSGKELSVVKASLKESQEQHALLETKLVALQQELASWQAKEKSAREKIAAVREQSGKELSVVKASLKESQEQHALLETKLVALKQELTRWQKAAEDAKGEAAKIASSVTDLKHDVTTATAEAIRWKKEAERARVEGSSQQASLQAELSSVQQKFAGVLEGEGKNQILQMESKARIGTLEAELAHAQAKLARSQSSAESDMDGSSSKLSSLEASLAQLRAQEAARTKKMAAIQAKLVACQAKEQTAQKENAELREAAKSGLCSLAASRDSVKAELVSVQKELARSLKAAMAAQKEAAENLTALTELQARQAELMAEVQSTKDELARWKTEAETARIEGKSQEALLQAELLSVQQELSRIREDAEAAQKRAAKKSLSLDELRSREAEFVAQMDAAQHEMVRLKEAEIVQMDGISSRDGEVKSQSMLTEGDANIEVLNDRSAQWNEVAGTVHVGEGADSQLPPVRIRTLEAEEGLAQVESSSKLTLLGAALAEARLREAAAVKEALLIKEEMTESQASAQAAREEIAALRYQTSKKKSSLEAALAETRKRAAALEVELTAATEELTQWRVEAKSAKEECIVLMTELRKLKGNSKEVDQGQKLQLESPSVLIMRQPSTCPQGVPDRFFLVEVGSWRIRAGWIEVERPEIFNPTHFPCVVARPKKVAADFSAIVQNASIQANAMYARFRRDGIFVGKDAWYCALDHPDPVLRGALKLEAPIVRDRLERPADLKWLLRDVLDKMNVDAGQSPIVVTYKATTTLEERAKMVEIMFEACEAYSVRFLNESSILSSLAKQVTALVIDVGEDTTRVVPVFEQVVVTKGIQTSALGGSDLTNYMSHMLLSCRNEVYSSLVERKMLEVARWIKERHAYVALDFKEEIGRHGSFEQEKIDVMKFQRDQIKTEESAIPGRRLNVATVAEPEELSEDSGGLNENGVIFRSPLSDGQELTLRVGRERFHCGELLFRPELFPDIGSSLGMTDLVLESLRNLDLDLWSSMLPHVLLAGQTSRIPGFAERLMAELKATLPEEYAALVNVRMLEGGNASGENGGEDRNQDPLSPIYRDIPAVSRAVAACAHKVVQGEEGWMSADAYSDFGAEALEKPVYSFIP